MSLSSSSSRPSAGLAARRAVTRPTRWLDDTTADPAAVPPPTTSGDPDRRLAVALLRAASRMHDSPDPQGVLRVIAEEALELVPADAVVLIGHDRSGPTPLLQLARHDQPGTGAALTGLFLQLASARLLRPGRVDEIALRRAQLVPAAVGAGADGASPAPWRSALVADLDSATSSRPNRLLWCSTTAGLPTDGGAAVLFARHAGLALRAVDERHHLHRAIEARTTTGQATGILMNRYHLTAARAFELLRRCSQNRNRTLHDIADTLVRTGQLPS